MPKKDGEPVDLRPPVRHTSTGSLRAADIAPNLPDGGTTTTIYDEHDRPTEVQVRDTHGELVNGALRTYDAQGHVSEEKQVYDNLVTMFSPETRQKLLDDSGLSADLRQELLAQLTQLMKGQAGPYSVSYRYDSEGRLIHTARRIFNHEDEIDTTYNEHGEAESEITRSTRPEAENETTAPGPPSSYSETRYSYLRVPLFRT